MNKQFAAAVREAATRPCLRGMMTLLAVGALGACSGGGGGSGGSAPPQRTLSADQAIYEDAALHGGVGNVTFNMPYGGGTLVSGTHLLYSIVDTLAASPLTSGPQAFTPTMTTLTAALAVPGPSKAWYVAGGQIVWRSAIPRSQVSYNGATVEFVQYANDGTTVVGDFIEQGFREVALTGAATGAPAELLANVPLDQWAAAGNFAAATQWQPGSFYVARKESLASDRTVLEACYPSPTMTAVSTATQELPCSANGTLASQFPVTLYPAGSAHPRETWAIGDGTISTVQGLQVWVASQPEPGDAYPTPAFRTFVQVGNAVYTGIVQKAGTQFATTLSDGSVVSDSFGLSAAALATVGQGAITFPTTAGSTAGAARNLKTLDLVGIGGTGVNGSLTPQDLRTHYDIPATLDGTGQTIALVNGPGPANIDFLDDLNAYSRAFGLPVCASSTSACFTHVDLSNGSFTGTGNGSAAEAALDIEMVHAIAPGSSIVLVTAASSQLSDMLAAVNYAASLPQVQVVSASWGYDFAANANLIRNEEPQLAAFVAQGKVFFASSGDEGQAPGWGPSYPAMSPSFTSVGGTRIHAVAPGVADTPWQYSGGGASPWMTMPAWQAAFIGGAQVAVNLSQRAVPDVTAVADPLHSPVALYFRQRWVMEGGTSVGAPVWAGIAALLGQHLSAGGSSLAARTAAASGGFSALLYRSSLSGGADPALQALGAGTTFSQQQACTTCSVGPGYNDVAGLGTPDVAAFIAAF